MRSLVFILSFFAAAAVAQTPPPHPLTHSPPAQPPIVLNPLPPQDRVDLHKGVTESAKLCTRDVFYPCPDERTRNCTRKETYRCN
jgi:hypothetical protein